MSYLSHLSSSISRYESGDQAALREFQIEYFGAGSRQCDDLYVEWMFQKNPYQEPGRPTVWICKRDGVVVGQQASIPVILKAGDSEYKAAWGVDLMVRTEWRLKGVAPALSAVYEQSAEVLLGLAMSEGARRAFLRRGWIDQGLLPVFVRPLDPAACAQTAHAPRFLTKLTPKLATRGSAHAAGALLRGLTSTVLEPITAFDERADAVWTYASKDYNVLVKRDFEYLRWRFDEMPGHTGYQRYYLKRRGEVVGYAVTRLEPWRGSIVGRLIDYLAPKASLWPLLALVIRELNSREVAAVFVEQLHEDAQRVLRMLGCFRAPAATRFIFNARGNAAPLQSALSSADAWFVNLADSDRDHTAAYQPVAISERREQVSSSA